jgi:hypothetical protein
MALVVKDRVQQTATANTTVSFTLTGTVTGFQTFATAIPNGNTTFYAATDASGNWEVGEGSFSTTGPTLTRLSVIDSSTGGGGITFVGTVTVFVTYPAYNSLFTDLTSTLNQPVIIPTSSIWNGEPIDVAYGGTGVTASSGANSVVLRNASQNINFNNFVAGYATTTASAGTTVLTVASARNQILVGSTTHTFQLPNATTLSLGQSFLFINNSSGNLTVVDNASTVVEVVPPGGVTQKGAISIATSAGTWGAYSFIPAAVNWGTNSLALGSTVISGGTWQGGTIASGYGGTGLTTFAAANNAIYSTSASALAAGTLPVAAGGTGATTFTANGVLYGNTASAVGVTAAGTTGQVLTAQTGGAPIWSASTITSATVNAGGTNPFNNTLQSIDFTGIPSGTKRITAMFNGVSLSGTASLLIRLGTAGGIVSTGYVSTAITASAAAQANSTSGFILTTGNSASETISGVVTIALIDTNTWCSSGVLKTGTISVRMNAGNSGNLGGELTQLRVTTTSTDTFDAGSINFLYD